MKKDPAAVALGRKGGLKGGRARAARLTPEQRSASARTAVRTRWIRAGKLKTEDPKAGRPVAAGLVSDTSDHALAALLTRLRVATDLAEISLLSEQIERVIFHKQFENA
jgi:hypothetical protein